jgi:hypothetical protein
MRQAVSSRPRAAAVCVLSFFLFTGPSHADVPPATRSTPDVPLGTRVADPPLGTPVADVPLGTPVNTVASSVTAAAEAALRALAPQVRRKSHPAALRLAFEAYYRYRAENPELVRKPYLYYVDLGLSNTTARGYVFDMESMTVVEGPFNVAHGRGSSRQRNGVPTRFSNRAGSKASSLGVYLAQETYTFGGKSGGRYYRSVGLRMRGESGEFNSTARARGIVAHGAPYVTGREAGRSEGCPAMEQHRAKRLLPLIANGGVVFLFSPNDARWLREDPWLSNS